MFKSIAAACIAGSLCSGCSQEQATTKPDQPQQLTNVQEDDYRQWTDEKGHYHPEWRAGINRPPGYPR